MLCLDVMTVTESSETNDPIAEFKTWLADAEASEPINPNGVALATSTPDGTPSVRMVLLKGVDERGFVFYTNSNSQKGLELAANPKASLCFYWRSLGKQVRVDGAVEEVSAEEADAYFQTRDRGARIGAWASKQTRPLEGRFDLEKRVAEYTAKFNIGNIPRPDFWTGYRIVPGIIEFWTEQLFRLHDRLVYHRTEDGWTTERLYP